MADRHARMTDRLVSVVKDAVAEASPTDLDEVIWQSVLETLKALARQAPRFWTTGEIIELYVEMEGRDG